MDELPSGARRLLDIASRADDPTPAARSRADAVAREALARHGVHDLPPLAAPREAGAPSATSGAGIALKLGLGTSMIVAALVGVRLLSREPARFAPAQTARTEARAAPRSPATPRADAAPRATPDAPPTREQPAVRTPPQPDRFPTPAPRARVRPTQRAESRAPTPATMPDDAELTRELKLLASVDQLVRQSRFAEALELLETNEPGSTPSAMREERAALHVLAQCGRQRSDQALRERTRFLASSPHSVLAGRVQKACAPESETDEP